MTKIKKIARLQHMEHVSQSPHLRNVFNHFTDIFVHFPITYSSPQVHQSGNAQTLLLFPQFRLQPKKTTQNSGNICTFLKNKRYNIALRGVEESRQVWQQLQSSQGRCYNPCTPGLGNILPCRSSQAGPGEIVSVCGHFQVGSGCL